MSTNQLTHITLTGVDEATDLAKLAELSTRFPLVEWGFLYSPTRQGKGGRYPSVATLQHAFSTLPSIVRVALHICGAGVPNLLAQDPEVKSLVDAIAARHGRVQLNFNQRRAKLDFNALRTLFAQYPTITFITQHNSANETVWSALQSALNHAVLFDSSGGRGLECTEWSRPLSATVRCGYSGGLGPDNLTTELPRIQEAAGPQPYWTDKEGKLRTTDDVFDLQSAENCLKVIYAFQARTTL